MAYQIDFTASNYASRARRKIFLRLLLLAAIGGTAYGVYDVYKTYNQPTLNMRLAEYEAVAHPIEEMNAVWDEVAKEYGAMMRYYRLFWAANPTNFLNAMASADAPQLVRGFQPESWTLKTGGGCTLKYRYAFNPGDKAGQAKALETNLVHAVTSVVEVATNVPVSVQGVQLENLLNVDELDITVRFSLPNAREFPAKERALTDCVSEIGAFRKKVQETKLTGDGDAKGMPSTAQGMMMAYLPIGKDKPDFPQVANVIDVAGWLGRANQFIDRNRMPPDPKRREYKAAWDEIGNARYPWKRYRLLDNEALVERTKVLEKVSDGVKRFRPFLEQRRADCKKKLESLMGVYDHADVFNKPLVKSDLADRFAKEADITRVRVPDPVDEAGAAPAVLVKEDEKFAFTWVRWRLVIGDAVGGERGQGNANREAGSEMPLTLEKLADCVRRVLKQPGPGYVLDTLNVTFGENGSVSGAVLEGLLPVKKVESTKEATPHAD